MRISILNLVPAFLLVLCCVFSVHGEQTKNLEIEIVPRWKKGDKQVYEMVHGGEKRVKGLTRYKGETISKVEIDVLNVNPDSYRIAWAIVDIEFGDKSISKRLDPMMIALFNLAKGLRFEFELKYPYSEITVVNWQEVQKMGKKTIDLLLKGAISTGMSQEKALESRKFLESIIVSKVGVENLLSRDAKIFFMPFGYSLTPGKPLKADAQLPNIFGGRPLPGEETVEMTAYDPTSRKAAISWSCSLKTKKAMPIIWESMRKRFGHALPKDFPSRDELPHIEPNIYSATFEIDEKSGWPTKISYVQVIHAKGLIYHKKYWIYTMKNQTFKSE